MNTLRNKFLLWILKKIDWYDVTPTKDIRIVNNKNEIVKIEFKENYLYEDSMDNVHSIIKLYMSLDENYKRGKLIVSDISEDMGDGLKLTTKTKGDGVEVRLSVTEEKRKKMLKGKRFDYSASLIYVEGNSYMKNHKFDILVYDTFFEYYDINPTNDVKRDFVRVIKSTYGRNTSVNFSNGLIIMNEDYYKFMI